MNGHENKPGEMGNRPVENKPPMDPKPKSPNVPNLNVIKGLLAIIFGLAFMIWAYKIIFNVIIFVIGAILIYYGLVILRVKQVTNLIDQMIGKIKKLFPQ